MKRRYIVILFILLIISLFVSCAKRESQGTDQSGDYRLSLKKIRTVRIHPKGDTLLARLGPVIAFNRDYTRIAWVDQDQHQIFITDTLGTILHVFGKTGKGPREFVDISSIGFSGKEDLLIYDWQQDVFKLFSESGILKKNVKGLIKDKLWNRSYNLYIVDHRIYIAMQEAEKSGDNDFWTSATIAEYDTTGSLLSLFGSYDPSLINNADSFYKYADLTVDIPARRAYTTHRTSPYIQAFDLDTHKKVAQFGLRPPSFKVRDAQYEVHMSDPRPVRNRKNLHQSFVGPSFVSKDRFYFCYFNFTEAFWKLRDPDDEEHYIAVYDKKAPYVFLGELSVPSLPLGVTPDNELYLLQNDDPSNIEVGVYDVAVAHN